MAKDVPNLSPHSPLTCCGSETSLQFARDQHGNRVIEKVLGLFAFAVVTGALSSGCSLLFEAADNGKVGASSDVADAADCRCDGPDCAWLSRRILRVEVADLSPDLVNFPVLVTLDSSNFEFNDGEGKDLRFRIGGVDLEYEIESWQVDGRSLVWVNVPSVSNGVELEMLYGNPDAQALQNARATWNSSYVGVWHLGGDLKDSTLNRNDAIGYPGTGLDMPSPAPGFLGQGSTGREFNGVDHSLEVEADPSINNLSEMHYEAWINTTGQGDQEVVAKGDSRRELRLQGDNLRACISYNTVDFLCETSVGGTVGSQWHHVAMNYSDTLDMVELFVDGEQVVSNLDMNVVGDSGPDEALKLTIGSRINNELHERFFRGTIDEVRISNVIRSDDWIRTSYLSGTDNLIVFGDREEVCN